MNISHLTQILQTKMIKVSLWTPSASGYTNSFAQFPPWMHLIETLTELIQNPTMLTSSRQHSFFQRAYFWLKEPFILDGKYLNLFWFPSELFWGSMSESIIYQVVKPLLFPRFWCCKIKWTMLDLEQLKTHCQYMDQQSEFLSSSMLENLNVRKN